MADDYIDVIARACDHVIAGDPAAAAALLRKSCPAGARLLRPDWPVRPDAARRESRSSPDTEAGKRRVPARKQLRVLQRDGFRCRYTGERLVHPSALYALSIALDGEGADPRSHPFGRQRFEHGGHQAFLDLFPAIDHLVPISRSSSAIIDTNGLDNLRAVTWRANEAKGDWLASELEGFADRPEPDDPLAWDGLSGRAVAMSDRYPCAFMVPPNKGHLRALLDWAGRPCCGKAVRHART